jgi:hypothetical protein
MTTSDEDRLDEIYCIMYPDERDRMDVLRREYAPEWREWWTLVHEAQKALETDGQPLSKKALARLARFEQSGVPVFVWRRGRWVASREWPHTLMVELGDLQRRSTDLERLIKYYTTRQ